MDQDSPEKWPRSTEILSTELHPLPGQMPVVRYLVSKYAPFYRVILDVLLEEESRLGLHLSTAEIARRLHSRVAVPAGPVDDSNVEVLLDRLYDWGNLDRIHNSQRKGTYQEYLKKDYLYQLTSSGARTHRALTEIDAEMGVAGALQSSMLPEVLSALRALTQAISAAPNDPRTVHAALLRVINGFTQLSENARLFVQGLNRALELDTQLDIDVFLAYKQIVVEYIQVFVVALARSASRIAEAIEHAEHLGVTAQIPTIALIEAAPTVGMSVGEVADRDSAQLLAQWVGLRRWFFGETGRQPVAQILRDRAADAVNRIVATVRRINDQRFRRHNRASDLLTLAKWFAGTKDHVETVILWRAAFGMYSARHLGAPHPEESGLDIRTHASWWLSPAAPIDARLRTQGPRATVGRPAALLNPRTTKRQLAARQAQRRDAIDDAIRRLATGGPQRMSQLHHLTPDELDTLLVCLDIALSTAPDSEGRRHARSSDGRLDIMVQPVVTPDVEPEIALIHSPRGSVTSRDLEITVNDRWRGHV